MTGLDDRTPEEWRDDLIEVVMMHAAFDGWTEPAFRRAEADLHLPEGYARLVFPGGVIEAVEQMMRRADRLMLAELARHDIMSLKIRDRIRLAVRTRLEQAIPHREAVRQAIGLLALPQHAALSARSLWRTADEIWRAAGDRATDYNHYTKRLILSGVYSTTLLVWTTDQSEGFTDSWAFLDRRIDNVMQFEKLKFSLLKGAKELPSPTRFLGRLRYGAH